MRNSGKAPTMMVSEAEEAAFAKGSHHVEHHTRLVDRVPMQALAHHHGEEVEWLKQPGSR